MAIEGLVVDGLVKLQRRVAFGQMRSVVIAALQLCLQHCITVERLFLESTSFEPALSED
jgi:hypothetical protein